MRRAGSYFTTTRSSGCEIRDRAMTIVVVVGARPNFVKVAPIMRQLRRRRGVTAVLVHTGQHHDDALSGSFFRDLDIPAPDAHLDITGGSAPVRLAEMIARLAPILSAHRPELVLVVGDVDSTLAGALAAAKCRIPIAHVEAGLRSFDRTMPEEINRVLTDSLAEFLFVTEEDAIGNLLKEGRPRESIFLVGNVMIDSLRHFLSVAERSAIGDELGLKNGAGWERFGLLTLHRPSNVDSP